VTRLVEQKGPYLIKHAASQALKLGGQFILLGSSPNKEIQKLFNELKKTYAHSKDLHIHFSYDEALSHHLFAAADMIIIPSLFEPCGLTQMIALRYGTIPIVRKTGGLADTIFDVEDETSPSEKHNGFSFSKLDLEAVSNVLKRAFDYCLYDRNTWNQLIKNGLNMHFNWDKSANQYLELYQLALQNSTSLSKLF
jgi:glycogen synthase